MKILVISSYYYPYVGGAELYTQKMAEKFADEGHEVHVITKNLEKLPDKEILNKVTIHRIKTPNIPFLRSILSYNKFLKKARELIKNVDIIHAHITYPNGIIAYQLSKKYHVPYIVTLQGDELMDYPEKKPLILLTPLIKKALQNASKIHCISKALEKSIQNRFAVPNNKTIIIPNGVDIRLFHKSSKTDFRYERPIAISVSRLTKKNGLDILLNVMKDLNIFSLIIVGEGHERTNLEEQAKKNNLKVHFLGKKDYKAIASLMKGSDFFIRTPRTEGLGIVFLEAMAAGIPVITTEVGGIPDIVKHEYNGLTSKKDDLEGIKSNIQRLLNNEQLRNKLVSNGTEFVKQYDWDIIFNKTQAIYRIILKDRT